MRFLNDLVAPLGAELQVTTARRRPVVDCLAHLGHYTTCESVDSGCRKALGMPESVTCLLDSWQVFMFIDTH